MLLPEVERATTFSPDKSPSICTGSHSLETLRPRPSCPFTLDPKDTTRSLVKQYLETINRKRQALALGDTYSEFHSSRCSYFGTELGCGCVRSYLRDIEAADHLHNFVGDRVEVFNFVDILGAKVCLIRNHSSSTLTERVITKRKNTISFQ